MSSPEHPNSVTEERRPPGARVADPLQDAMQNMPYVVLPDVSPRYRSKDLKRARLQMQRDKLLDERARLAFRDLSNLPTRLAWDALCTQVVPLPSTDLAEHLNQFISQDDRRRAYDLLREEVPDSDSPESLHVFVALLAHDLVDCTRGDREVLADTWKLYVGLACALLAEDRWLVRFARNRCNALHLRGILDGEKHEQFVDKLGSFLENIAERSMPADPPGVASASFALECEEVAIEIAAEAFAHRRPQTPINRFGPRGLKQLGLAAPTRKWVAGAARRYQGGLPLTQFRERLEKGTGRADRDADCQLLQWTYSSLGPIICHLWHGRPKDAWRLLGKLKQTREEEVDPWFGTGRGGRLRLARSLDELRAEVLLDVFRQQLGNPDDSCDEVCFTAEHALQLSDSLRNAAPVVEEVENALCGRLGALSSTPHHPDMARALKIARALRESLIARDHGEHCSIALASALKARAVKTWNNAGSEEAMRRAAHLATRDMFQAVELVPRSADLIMNLGRLVWQIQRFETSTAARTDLLRKALRVMERCLEAGAPSNEMTEIRQIRDDILGELSPREAISERLKKLQSVLDGNDE